jgi:uncharacterized protein YdaU (DUF1376 family)
MAEELPYMRLWVGDLLADMGEHGWTDEELGIYFRLLLVAWRKGSIPADMATRARLVSASETRLAELWPAIEHKWEPDGNGGLVNQRQERERSEAVALHRARKAAGAKGGKAKAKQGSSRA